MHAAFASFLGKRGSNGVVTINSEDFETDTVSPTISTCTVTFNSNKSFNVGADNSPATPVWLTGGSSSGYELRVTLTFGTFSSSSGTDSWLSLGTSRSYTVQRVSSGTKSCAALFEIRNATTLVVEDSATISLTAFMDIP